ncbi:MAG: cardiolipin synthase [Thermoplasmatota archaeon]
MDIPAWLALALSAATLAVPFVMLFFVPRGRRPGSAIAWLLVIALLPWFGLAVYLILGNPRLPRQRRERQRAMEAEVRAAVEAARSDPAASTWIGAGLTGDAASIAALAESLGGLPAVAGNRIDVLSDYDAMIASIAQDIDDAQRFVHLQYYILAMDDATEPVHAAMERAASRGVTVRVLLDHIGSRGYAAHRAMLRRFDEAGIQWRHMLPFQPLRGRIGRPDLRNHRKIVVVDGRIAYVGSQNMIERAYRKRPSHAVKHQYLEIVARVGGPTVQQLDAVFRMDWMAETGETLTETPGRVHQDGTAVAQVLPGGPGHPVEENLRVFNSLLYHAQERIVIVNAYFVPDETLMMAITTAAQRGVHVDFITPAKGNQVILAHAQRSFYEDLLAAGVHIHLHPKPWNLHSKTMTIDDDIAVIGSSNLDIRSFELNLEASLLCYDEGVVRDLRALEATYMAQSTLLKPGDLRLHAGQRLVDNLARLTSSLQ